ncbi:MAG TPA: helix-turn-helix transcriptional regulator [Polyangium sp.]|nr:helix-turn-helix transcriptional regulator [Polyangium sp.]
MPRRTHTTSFTLDFGERLRSLRLEQGISLSQLAATTGISKGHLSSIEQGFAAITIESAQRLAIGLNLSPTMLMAFPKNDEYAVILDLVHQLPTTYQKRLRKLLKQWVAEVDARH